MMGILQIKDRNENEMLLIFRPTKKIEAILVAKKIIIKKMNVVF